MRFIWLSDFNGKYFIRNQPIRYKNCLCRPFFANVSGRNEQSLWKTFHRCFLPNFDSFGQAISEEKIHKIWPIRNKNRMWRPCLLTDLDEMSNLYSGSSINDSYQVSIHLAKRFQRRIFFRNQPIRNKNCLWRPYLLTDRDEMNNLYRRSSIIIPTKFRFIWQSGFSGEDFFLVINQSETRIVCACHFMLTDREEIINLYRGESIDPSYQVSVHLAKGFQRRRLKSEKLTDDGRQVS